MFLFYFVIGISLHNFPEGMAVFLGSIKVNYLRVISGILYTQAECYNVMTSAARKILHILEQHKNRHM